MVAEAAKRFKIATSNPKALLASKDGIRFVI